MTKYVSKLNNGQESFIIKDGNSVSILPEQGLTNTEKANARANIGAGTSNFSGNYNELTNKPTIPSVGNAEIEIQKNGTKINSFTTNQSGSKVTINITVPTGTAADKNVPSSGNASSSQVVLGSDTRLTNSRPASDVYSWAKASSKPTYSWSEITDKPTIPSISNDDIKRAYLAYVAVHPEDCYFTFIYSDETTYYFGFTNSDFYYSKDLGKTWTHVTSSYPTIGVSIGDIILLKGTITPQVYTGVGSIICNKKFKVAGNPMSLIYGDDFKGKVEFPNGMEDYGGFFNMFLNCTTLKSAKHFILPVLNVPHGAYVRMFYNCTSLIEGPIIAADTLYKEACSSMFYECLTLSYINTRFKTVESDSLSYWCYNLPSKGIFIKNINATWTNTGVNGVPTGWQIYYDYQHDKFTL